MTYEDFGFDATLQRELFASPITTQLSGLDYSSQTPDVSISKSIFDGILTSKDGKFTINMVEGFLSISDGNDQIGRLGRQTDGSYGILLKNSKGEITLSNEGVPGESTFQNGAVTKATNQTIVGDDFVDIIGLQLSFETINEIQVLFLATILGNHQDFDGVLIVQFWLDGAAVGPQIIVGTGGTTLSVTGSAQFVKKVSPGHHVLKLRARGNNASPSEAYVLGTVTPSVLNYIILGK